MTTPKTGHALKKPGTRRILLLVLAAAVGLLLLLALLAPSIASTASVRRAVLARASRASGLDIQARSWSVSWWTGVSLSDLSVRDPAGPEIVRVPSVRVPLRWRSLLGRRIDLGDVLLERPKLRLDSPEKMLAFLAPAARPAGAGETPAVAMRLSVVDGVIELVSDEKSSTLEDWKLNLDLPPAGSPLTFETHLRAGADGSLRCKGSLTKDDAAPAFTGGDVSVEAKRIALDLLAPFLRPSSPVTAVAGLADLSLEARWQKGAALDANLTARIEDFALAGQALSGDTLNLARLELSGDVALSDSNLTIRRFDAKSELFSASAAGTLGGPGGESSALELRAEADLAALGNMLPRAFHLAEGTRLTGGKASLVLNSSAIPEGWRAAGSFELSDLSGERAGRSFAMVAPVTGDFALRRSPEEVVLERATFSSSFGQAQGATDGKTVTLNGVFDLAALETELAQFVDLKGVALAGKAKTSLSVNVADPAAWIIRSDTAFSDLVVAGLTDAPIEEKEASVTFSGVYRAAPGARAVEIKDLEVSGSALQVKLSGEWRELNGSWQAPDINGTAGGRLDLLSKLFSRRLGGLRASGKIESEFRFGETEGPRAFDLRAKCSDLSLEGFLGEARPSVLRSKSVNISAKGAWTAGEDAALVVESFLVKTDFAECAGAARLRESSAADLRISLERLLCDLAGLADNTVGLLPSALRPAGALKGRGSFSTTSESPFAFDLVADIAGLSLRKPDAENALFEDNVSVDLAGAWRPRADEGELALSRLRVSTDKHPNLARLSGDANALHSDGSFTLAGDLAFPLALAAPFLEGRLPGYSFQGDVAWSGKLDFRRGNSLLADGKLACADLDVTLPKGEGRIARVRESSLKADLGLAYDFPSAGLRVDRLVLDAPDLHLVSQLAFDELGKEPLPARAEVSGQVQLAPFLERYGALLSVPDSLKLAGAAEIKLSASTASKVTKASGKILVQRFSMGDGPAAIAFSETPVEIVALLRADRAAETLALESLSVSSSPANLKAKGVLANYRNQQDLDLSLDLSGDLGPFEAVLKTFLPEGMVLEGNAAAKLEASGPVQGSDWRSRLSSVAARGILSFDKLLYKGLVAGPISVPLELKQGTLYIAESSGPLNEGKLRLAGSIDLMKNPPLYELKSPLLAIEGMRLKRDVEFIHFLSPIFGNLAEVDGWADVELASATLPLSKDASRLARAAGEVRYRDLRVSESLLLARLAGAIGGASGGVQKMDPTRFEVRDARVWLDETVLHYAAQDIAFGGSVGFDRTLDILVRVLVTERLLGKDAGLMGLLVGEKVGIPITGTIDDPKVGADILRKNMANIVKGALTRTKGLGEAIRGILPLLPGQGKEREE